ncbi:MAG: DUF3126 family protein [Kordiimonadaceae bacterium]|jgi:hypothetical protein|nr:DUF3126 family protein [Kordiimonadaceae bacterium]MBT6036757.1 DUF3126 family protein [Kordiimonadaceae bacterium]MBT6329834.1 DUF3126 family protein [Kordiimonadaceae bacterium]MBT7582994.1 DUF3126 family protein [Kordiimonadaceae bacterium]
MTRTEILRIQKYLNSKFESSKYTIVNSQTTDDSMEVHFDGEFIGMIYKDEDEGEVSYALQMAILEMDLPSAADASLI